MVCLEGSGATRPGKSDKMSSFHSHSTTCIHPVKTMMTVHNSSFTEIQTRDGKFVWSRNTRFNVALCNVQHHMYFLYSSVESITRIIDQLS